jgi:curli biogenesis system outer membrane secretion channel CsgG
MANKSTNRTLLCLALSAVAFFMLPASSLAQGKVRIAIWEFDNNAGTSYWFYNQMGPAARNHIDTAFSQDPKLTAMFSVVEREKLGLVLKEQGLAASGAVDPATAAKVGRILGVKYIIMGGIDKFNIESTRAAVNRLGVGGNVVKSFVTINLRVVDTTTAERVISISADGDTTKGGGFLRGTSLSRENEWGIASETIEKAAKAVVAEFVQPANLARVTSAATPTVVEGRIIQVEGVRAYINLGSSSGVKVGDTFNIINVGQALIDPDTGAKLGAIEKQTGSGKVVEVQDKFSIIQFTGAATAKDTIRKP